MAFLADGKEACAMPVSLASLPGAVRKAGEEGMREGIRKELDRLRPQMAEKFGFATGLTILLIGYRMQKRKQRLDRIERKLDRVVEEDADDS
jgi:hypothetical protein